MFEPTWDIKRGIEIYHRVFTSRLGRWIVSGKIKAGEVVVWRSGFSGWRKPEDLEELAPYFAVYGRRIAQKRAAELPHNNNNNNNIKKILVIEDEQDLCFLLGDILARKGYQVQCVHTQREAVLYLKRRLPQMIFLDLKLPDGDGISLLKQIREMDRRIIVDVISAYGSEEKKNEALGLGIEEFIDKPFTEEKIFNAITQAGKI